MNVPKPVQEALAVAGLYPGKIDGLMGPMTLQGLMATAAHLPLDRISPDLAKGFWLVCVESQITNRLRLLHALAQACVETACFQHMVEQGSSAYFARYDGRFGNRPGEGYLYRGRGPIMLTFHDNYADMGPRLGLDLLNHPDQAADPYIGSQIFGLFWTDHHLNVRADADDLAGIRRAIQGGAGGLDDARTYLNRLKGVWPS